MASAKSPIKYLRCPTPLLCKDPRSFRGTFGFYHRVMQAGGLDLGHLQFVDPPALVLFHQVFLMTRTREISIMMPKDKLVHAIVSDLLWPAQQQQQVSQQLELQLFKSTPSKSPNNYPLRRVAKEKDLAPELGKWRTMLTASKALEEERARQFSSTMAEVLTNSFTHARTAHPCMVAGQTFPKKKHSVLAAADTGRSIPVTLDQSGRYRGKFRTDHEWIVLSLEKGVTCQTRPDNRGFGLYYLVTHIRQNGGKMLIVSGDGLVFCDGDTTRAEALGPRYPRYNGTFLMLDIATH